MLLESLSIAIGFLWQNILLISILSVIFYELIIYDYRLPSGPWGLPIVGYVPFLSTFSHLDLNKLSKKYGPVFSVRLGLNQCVIVNDFENAVDVLNNEICRDRPEHNLFNMADRESFITWRGDMWKAHRRFLLRALRSIGVGKPKVEDLIRKEIGYLCDKIESNGESAVGIRKLLSASTSNIVLSVVLGRRYDYDHPIRVKFDEVFTVIEQPFMFTSLMMNFCKVLRYTISITKHIPFTIFSKFEEIDKYFTNLYDGVIKDHIDESNNEDIIGAYLEEMEKNSDNPHYDRKNIRGIIDSLHGAGSSTIKDTIEWVLLYLCIYPEIQDKIMKELIEVIGLDRMPTYTDRQKMIYTQAVIQETLRISSLVPINIPHVASADTKIGQHFIPKGTVIYINFHAINHDPKYWDQPDQFRPERFLDKTGTTLIKRDGFIPFGTGKRSCPGEPLAQVELFMYLAYILQRYHVQSPPDVQLSDKGIINLFSYVPNKPELIFKPRKVV